MTIGVPIRFSLKNLNNFNSIHVSTCPPNKLTDVNGSLLDNIQCSIMNNKRMRISLFRNKKMKFDDNEILLINILLETHTMGTTAIT